MAEVTFATILADITTALTSAGVQVYVMTGVVLGLLGVLIRQIKRAGK